MKQLSAEHGVAEEDIRLQMQAVQDIVRAEVEKKVEKERMEEEKRRSEEIAREREEAEEKRRREEIEKMVRQREEEEREQNWAEKEELGLKAMYQRKRKSRCKLDGKMRTQWPGKTKLNDVLSKK